MITINLNGNTSSIVVNLQNITAKQALEIGTALESMTSSVLTPEDFQTQFVRETCEQYADSKLMCVKLIKQQFNHLGLTEAKDLVDKYFDKLNTNKSK